MKVLKIFLIFVFPFTFSCKKLFDSGEIVEEIREVDSIAEIEIHDMFKVKIHHDPTCSLIVKCGEKLLPDIKTELNNGVLVIKNDNPGRIRRNGSDIEIDIYSNDINRIHLYSSSTLVSEDTLKYNTMRIYAETQIASINLTVDIPNLSFSAYHSTGFYTFSGKVDNFNVYNQGLGQLKAFDLVTKNATVNNYSVGDCSINVSDTLRYNIYNVGNINYKGDPYIYNGKTPSNGRLIKISE